MIITLHIITSPKCQCAYTSPNVGRTSSSNPSMSRLKKSTVDWLSATSNACSGKQGTGIGSFDFCGGDSSSFPWPPVDSLYVICDHPSSSHTHCRRIHNIGDRCGDDRHNECHRRRLFEMTMGRYFPSPSLLLTLSALISPFFPSCLFPFTCHTPTL